MAFTTSTVDFQNNSVADRAGGPPSETSDPIERRNIRTKTEFEVAIHAEWRANVGGIFCVTQLLIDRET